MQQFNLKGQCQGSYNEFFEALYYPYTRDASKEILEVKGVPTLLYQLGLKRLIDKDSFENWFDYFTPHRSECRVVIESSTLRFPYFT